MPTPAKTLGKSVWDLPPLILHPFNERVPPATLLENSKAALMLAGLIPDDGSDQAQLQRRVLSGRYAEIRMLYYLGKDLFRWIEQCEEQAGRIRELEEAQICAQSFAGLLAGNPPPNVKEKLIRWGVGDYSAIFARAIGLNAAFAAPPAMESLTGEFLRNYHRYADGLYRAFMETQPHGVIAPPNFRFEVYASGEYSRMLESEWGE
jgi:hypothetical protein